MNELNKTASDWRTTDKHELSERIIKNSAQLLEDYVLWRKCGWSDEEFGNLIGVSAKTVRNRYLADARRQGLIEAGTRGTAVTPLQNSRKPNAHNRALPVENSNPIRDAAEQVVGNDEQEDAIREVFQGFANIIEYEQEEAAKELSPSDQRAQWALAKTAEIWDDDWNEMNEELVTKDEACKLVRFWKGRAESSHYGRQMDRADKAWEKDARHIDVIKNRIPKLSATEKEELLQMLMKETSVTIHHNVQTNLQQIPPSSSI